MLAARIRVTGPFAQFFLSPAGNDANPATQVAPMRTHAALWQYMREDFDFAGKPVQVVHSDGAYPDGIAQWGKLVGDPSSIQWLGNLTNPGACILRPESGHAVKLGHEARGTVEGFHLDMSLSPVDTVSIEEHSNLLFGKNVFGYQHGNHDIQVGSNARFKIIGGYTVSKGISVGQTHIQLDHGSSVYSTGDGAWGSSFIRVIGAPQYTFAFAALDEATIKTGGLAWLRDDAVSTSFSQGFSGQGSTIIPVATVAGVSVGHLAVSAATLWGTQVLEIVPVGTGMGVRLSHPTILGVQAGTPIQFGYRGVAIVKRYDIRNGGRLYSNTKNSVFYPQPDETWMPGNGQGFVDGLGSYYM